MRQLSRRICATTLVVVAAACAEQEGVTSPDGTVSLPPAERDWTVGQLDQFALNTPQGNDSITPWQFANVAIPTGVPVKITVSGFLDFAVNPQFTACWGSPPPAPPGGIWTLGPGGFNAPGRPWQVAVRRDSSWLAITPANPTAAATVAFAQGPGTINAGRPVWLNGACGSPSIPHASAYLVTGTQTVTIEALDSARVVPDKDKVVAGDTVTFQVQVSWDPAAWVNGNWQWVPDTTTNTSSFVGSCFKKTTCKVIVRERGHVVVSDVRAQGMGLDARSPIIEMYNGRVKIQPLSGPLEVRPAMTGGTTSLALKIGVYANGQPIPNRIVDLSLDGLEGTAGHVHGGTMPPGSLSSSTVNTGASGLTNVAYLASAFGGHVSIKGTSTGADSALETITVRVPGLQQLMEAGNVDTIGPTDEHPNNHWGTATMVSALQALADTFYAYTSAGPSPRKLQFNDISLILGGKFDLSAAYNPGGEHGEHKVGNSADVRTHGDSPLTGDQRKFVYDWWTGRFGRQNVYVHDSTTSAPHYHLRTP